MEHYLNKVKTALKSGLPGTEIQYQMAPVGRKLAENAFKKQLSYKASAVTIVFCNDEYNRVFIPLIVRKTYNGAHSGQVSFPGGKFEEHDVELINTARRECFEEIGLKELEILGALTELFIPVSGFKVQPFVGYCKINNPKLILQEREVESLLKLHVEDLLNEAMVNEGPIKLGNSSITKAPYFNVQNHQVWGATAMMLNELKHLLK